MTTVVNSCATTPTERPKAPAPPSAPMTICTTAATRTATARTRSAVVARAGARMAAGGALIISPPWSSLSMVEITRDVGTLRGEGGAVSESGETERDRLVALLQDYADEATRLGHAFAAEQGLHRTDAQALLAVLRAERAGAALTPG